MTQTTVFQSGNSQAVRLPKEFRFKSKTVEIYRRGDEVVLREMPRTMRELLDSMPPLSDEDNAALDEMMAIIDEKQPPDTIERAWGLAPMPQEPRDKTASKTASKAARPRKIR